MCGRLYLRIGIDKFGGVGTTLISALKNGRKAVCVEKEELYCQIAQERVLDFFKGKLKCREMSQEIYTPKNDSVARVPEEWRGLGVYWKLRIGTPTSMGGSFYRCISNLWQEIMGVITNINAYACQTKTSQEKGRIGVHLFSPVEINKAF